MTDSLLQDIRYALRGLTRTPALTIAVTLSFAIGVGVNAGLFTVVDRVFFHAPPGVTHPETVRRLMYYARGGQSLTYAVDNFTVIDHDALGRSVRDAAIVEGYSVEDDLQIGSQ